MLSKRFLEQFNQDITPGGQEIINEFFITFSRFECALKTTGFVLGGEERVLANWDKFTASIEGAFGSDMAKEQAVRDSIHYLINYPPKVQNITNQRLGWRNRIFDYNQPQINRLSLSIRDIRNNLFHGGKFNGDYQEDVSRNYILLKSGIVILNYWLSLSNPVRNSFLERI